MRIKLNVKITAAFALVTLVLFIITSFLADAILRKQFEVYAIARQEQKIQNAVSLIADRYDINGHWDVVSLETLGMNLLGEGLLLNIKDNYGNIIWDANTHNSGMCADVLAHMAHNMNTYAPNVQGAYTEMRTVLQKGSVAFGEATVGYYGPYFLTDADVLYLRTLNRLMLWATFAAAMVATVVGMGLANALSKPIRRINQYAEQIALGKYDAHISEKSTTTEIIALTDTINHLAETLSKEESMRNRQTADVAHELRTPIATLQSHLEAMIDGVWAADTVRLTSCHEETVRLAKLVADFEQLHRTTASNLHLEKLKVDVSAIMRRIITNMENQFRLQHITLDFKAETAITMVDEDKMSQVFLNLLSNALHYTPENGTVWIEIETNPKQIIVRVRDNGIGIAPEDLPRIFDRLYRTDKSRSRHTGGAGIGLAIVKSIIEAHGGSISVESEINKGSTFILVLPL